MTEQAPRPKVVCAWCPGFNPGRPAELTSHGICAQCFARMTDTEPPPEVPMAPSGAPAIDEDDDPLKFHD